MFLKNDTVEPKCSIEDEPTTKKIKSGVILDDKKGLSYEPPKCLATNTCYPLFSISDWVELATTTHRLTIAILLISGVSLGDFLVRISKDGNTLTIIVRRPDPLVNLKYLHHKWLFSNGSDRNEKCHSILIVFENFLR